MPTTKHLFWPIIDLQGPFLLPNYIIYITIDWNPSKNRELWLKTDFTSTFLCSCIFIDIQIIYSVTPPDAFFVPWYQIKMLVRLIRVVNTSSISLLLKLDYFFQNYPSLSSSHNKMLKCKMIVQKSAVTTQYGSVGAQNKSRICSLIDFIVIIIPNFAI